MIFNRYAVLCTWRAESVGETYSDELILYKPDVKTYNKIEFLKRVNFFHR